MKRTVFALLATAALVLSAAPFALAAGGAEGHATVMVMKHACNPDVNNLDDFNAIIDAAAGPVEALAATVLACPAVVNPGDDTSDNGIKADAAQFSFTVADAAGTNELPENSMAAKLCESDLNVDADGDGEFSTEVCLDVSHYVFEGLENGPVTVTETDPPAGYRFGEVLFTPTEIDDNNDADSLVSVDRDAGVIELDTTADEDGMVMLHVYNFENEQPDSATALETVTENGSLGISLALVLAVGAAFGIWFAATLRRRDPSSN